MLSPGRSTELSAISRPSPRCNSTNTKSSVQGDLNSDYAVSPLNVTIKWSGVSRPSPEYMHGLLYGKRFKKHLRAPSPIYAHANTTFHHIMVKFSSLWVGSLLTLQGPSRSSLYQGHWSILCRNIGSFSCPSYGMRSCSTPPTSNLSRPFYSSRCSLHMAHTPLWWTKRHGGSQLMSYLLTTLVRYMVLH